MGGTQLTPDQVSALAAYVWASAIGRRLTGIDRFAGADFGAVMQIAQVMQELVRRNLIRPVTTQGHIGDVLPDKVAHDAQTTLGLAVLC